MLSGVIFTHSIVVPNTRCYRLYDYTVFPPMLTGVSSNCKLLSDTLRIALSSYIYLPLKCLPLAGVDVGPRRRGHGVCGIESHAVVTSCGYHKSTRRFPVS